MVERGFAFTLSHFDFRAIGLSCDWAASRFAGRRGHREASRGEQIDNSLHVHFGSQADAGQCLGVERMDGRQGVRFTIGFDRIVLQDLGLPLDVPQHFEAKPALHGDSRVAAGSGIETNRKGSAAEKRVHRTRYLDSDALLGLFAPAFAGTQQNLGHSGQDG